MVLSDESYTTVKRFQWRVVQKSQKGNIIFSVQIKSGQYFVKHSRDCDLFISESVPKIGDKRFLQKAGKYLYK